MRTRVDACVIGGGIIGLAVAFELALRGRRVAVVERARIGERAAASVAAGMLAPVFEADHLDPAVTAFALTSRARYGGWVERIEAASGTEVGYDTTGALVVALHRDHQAQIDHLLSFMRDRGLRAEPVDRVQLRELEPAVAPFAVGGLCAGDVQVDPRRLLGALTRAITHAGAELIEHARVGSLELNGHDWEVAADGKDGPITVAAHQVVIAAGAWTAELPGLERLPLRPVRGQTVRLRGEPLIRHVVRTPDVYLVPRADGEIVVGATMEERGFDDRPLAGDVLDLLREAARVVPGIRDLQITECVVGFRPALRDGRPAIGPFDRPGMFLAAGHYRNGVLLAPLTAELLADQMTEGRRDVMLEPFDPARFALATVVA